MDGWITTTCAVVARLDERAMRRVETVRGLGVARRRRVRRARRTRRTHHAHRTHRCEDARAR